MKTKKIFKQLWVASVDIEAMPNYDFMELIDRSDCNEALPKYIGAWANVIIQAPTIKEALSLIEIGLNEKKFKIRFIDKIESLYSLVEDDEINIDMIKEAEWLYKSQYSFMISDKLWPYVD
jgi:hypothetical protein